MKQLRFFTTLVVLLVFSICAFAADDNDAAIFTYKISSRLRERRKFSSVYWFPLTSFLTPGFAQYWDGQFDAGLTYSIVGGIGIGAAAAAAASSDFSQSSASNTDFSGLSPNDELYQWGGQTYQDVGFLSVYHAFRSEVTQRPGDFDFLTEQSKAETPDVLMMAPFHVQFLARPTTYIPMALAVALFAAERIDPDASNSLSVSDDLFTLGSSYNAGVSEEAFFRGYLMMNFRQSWGSDIWSNLGSSTIFAAAHVSSSNPVPLPQLGLGIYLAWLAQHRNWTLAEGVFIHAWWDVIAIAGSLIDSDKVRTVRLPPWTISF